ncbi:magnesium transporter [Polychytrium aggregatum]|uniref:magnesium transporter n=1 Tax=Polychytrium aggregatum TaxID=110093 RepID=UPI0022FDE84D|nr:magnesium transporter [Polychytrium aggregatum]KAI9203943.1 magnesium transporter [Polychytrium aggregatum]
MADPKYVGLALALSSGLLIGSSFIITKKGLIQSAQQSGGATHLESHSYLKNGLWWAGLMTMILGEIANFTAYTFAPAILVTPLGAFSVVIGSVGASVFLHETMSFQGQLGCALSIIGSVIVILHSPEEKSIDSVDEILTYFLQPGKRFMVYMFLVSAVSLFLIYRIGPVYGSKNILVYITICSLVGSVSVMAVKAFGVAIRLTIEGNNQLIYPSTWLFGFIVIGCALTQINYFNKSLDLFSTNQVTPIYYVFFTSATIVASVILFQGFNDSDPKDIVSIFGGFITIFIGVFMINAAKDEQHPIAADSTKSLDKIPLRDRDRYKKRSSVSAGESSLLRDAFDENSPDEA